MQKLIIAVIFIILFLPSIFLIRYFLIGQAVYGDGIYYYAYTRSIVKDGDLHFENELEHRYAPDTNNNINELDPAEIFPDTPTNHVSNKYPIGPGLLWIPPFFVADIMANTINLFDKNFPSNGYSDLYQIFVGLFSITAVLGGTYFLYKTLLYFFKKNIAFIATITTLLGTNLFYYSAIDSINSHPFSFFFGSLFFYFLFKKNQPEKFLILGFISGILSLIRTQDIIFLLLTLLYLLLQNYNLSQFLKKGLLTLMSFIFVFSIQLLSWKIVYGTFFAFPYISQHEGFNFFSTNILGVLFSLKVGLFIWTPFYILAFLGLLKKGLKIATFFVILQLFLISSWSGWTQGESFGIRMIISVLPLFSIGYGFFISKLKPFWSYALLILLIVFNFSAILFFLIYIQNSTIDRGEVTQTQVLERFFNLIN